MKVVIGVYVEGNGGCVIDTVIKVNTSFFMAFSAFLLIFLVESSSLLLLKSTLTWPSLPSSTLTDLAALLKAWSHHWNSNSSALIMHSFEKILI